MRLIRRLFGHDVSADRERKRAVVSQLTVDSERVTADSDKAQARVIALLGPDRLASYRRVSRRGRGASR